MSHRAKFAPSGTVAMLSTSWGKDYDLYADEPTISFPTAQIAVVEVQGPLKHHGVTRGGMGFWDWDSYEAITDRVGKALASAASIVILRIDSPGGEAAGTFETAKRIKAMAAAANKTLIAYANEQICSAAFALACGCSAIYTPPGGQIGAIGVIQAVLDETQADAQNGLKVYYIVSGARKADAHPHAPVTPEVLAALQHRVDLAADEFWQLAADARGLTPAKIAALQANVFVGQEGVDVGIADAVISFEDLVTGLTTGAISSVGKPQPMTGSETGEDSMNKNELVAAIRHAADQGDAVMKAVCAMLDGKTPPPAKDDKADDKAEDKDKDKEPAKSEEEEKKAAAEEEEKKAKSAEEEKTAKAMAASNQELAATVAKLSAESLERRKSDEKAERAMLLASHDMPNTTRKALESETQSIEVVRAMCATFPAAVSNPLASMNLAGVSSAPTMGLRQGTGSGGLTPEQKQRIDEGMGLVSSYKGIRLEGRKHILGVQTPDMARERIAAREAQKVSK